MKARPGQKICSSCDEINGVRAFECKNCGIAFKMKKARRGPKKKQVEDFTTLKKGRFDSCSWWEWHLLY